MSEPVPPPTDDSGWPELRDHDTEPVSAHFLDETLAAIDRDEGVAWSRLLARHLVPAPSADFVDRTCARVVADSVRAAPLGGRRTALRRAWLSLAAAAGLLVAGALAWRFTHPAEGPGARVWADAHPVARSFALAARETSRATGGDSFFSRVRFDDIDGLSLLASAK
ncbi:MAG: hypothetical protein R3F56_19060 [Planctomycetota bacterium]